MGVSKSEKSTIERNRIKIRLLSFEGEASGRLAVLTLGFTVLIGLLSLLVFLMMGYQLPI